MGARRLVSALFLGAWSVFAGVGCGGRTGLYLATHVDHDGVEPADSGVVDAALPALDVTPKAVPVACVDAGDSLIYVITDTIQTGAGHLFSFDPDSAEFRAIGPVVCPTTGACLEPDGGPMPGGPAPSPFSMAVDREGLAYVVYCDGELFRVSTATGACKPTGFVAPAGFARGFGMGFAQDAVGSGETLYVASPGSNLPAALASIQTTTFALNVVAPFEAPITEAELTGTGAGALFAFYQTDKGVSSAIGQVDKVSARVIAQSSLPGLAMGAGWAFAFWGGDFYTFTAPDLATSIVTRFRPADGSAVPVATLDEIVVGAGVSTCAPQQ
jgi:hypothetical protein